MNGARFLELLKKDMGFLADRNKLVGAASYFRHRGERRIHCYGLTGDAYGTPVRADTLYDMASLSKVLGTTMAVLRLAEQRKITLDTSVRDILPLFRHGGVRVAHLLSHSSGLPADLPDKHNLAYREMVAALYGADLVYETGKDVVYSDVGFILLGFLVDRLTEGLHPFTANEIFAPLAMRDTGYLPQDKKRCAPTAVAEKNGRPCYMQGEVNDSKARILNGVCGSAGLFSTLTDSIVFVDALLASRHPVLSSRSVETLFEAAADNGTVKRSVGWTVHESPSGRWIYHSGFTGTSILLSRDADTAFVFLSNAVLADRDKTVMMEVRQKWLDTLMGKT